MDIDEDYFNSEDFRELLSSYESSEASGNPLFLDPDDMVDLAEYYNYIGEEEKAEDIVQDGLRLYPHDTLLNVFMAREALLDYDFQTARDYADAIEDKEAPDYHYLVAEIMIAQEQIEEADDYLRELYVQMPADEVEDYVKDVANLYIDYHISEKAYEWMMRLKGDTSDDFKELMAQTLFLLGKYKDSQQLFNELIDHNPFSKYYWNALASAQFMDEDYSAAVTSSEYAIAIDPEDADGLIAKANSLMKLENYEEAVDYYQRALRVLHDEVIEPYLNIGVSLANLRRYEEATEALQQAAAIAKSKHADEILVHIYEEQAFCLALLERTDEAIAILDETRSLPCDHNEILVIRGHIQLAAQRPEAALNDFQQAINDSNHNFSILLRIIVSLYDNHYLKEAYIMFQRLFDMYSGNHRYEGYAYMALCCYDLGRFKEFMQYLKEAASHNPTETQLVLSHLFPEGMDVSDYYAYMERKLQVKSKE